jgi:uncharacterized protein involved in exopolysaccharide biosynthesis
VNVLLEHRTLMIVLPLLLSFFVIVRGLATPRNFEAASKIFPGDPSATSTRGIVGLAAQFGFGVAPPVGSETAEFYRQLLTSREVLREVAYSKYTVHTGLEGPDSVRTGNFLELNYIEGDSTNEGRMNAIFALEGSVFASADQMSNIITLSVRSPMPDLALQINRRLLQLADEFNAERRQTQAKSEREFVEKRLGESRAALRAAQDRMTDFLERNRTFSQSPTLSFERSRLELAITENQTIYTTLSQAYQQASINEVRNTPVLSIVMPPETVIMPMARGIALRSVLAFMLGLILAATIAFTRTNFARKYQAGDEDYLDFVRLSRSTINGMLRFVPAALRRRIRSRWPWLDNDLETTK